MIVENEMHLVYLKVTEAVFGLSKLEREKTKRNKTSNIDKRGNDRQREKERDRKRTRASTSVLRNSNAFAALAST